MTESHHSKAMPVAKRIRISVQELGVNSEHDAIVMCSQRFKSRSIVDKTVGWKATNEILLSNLLPDTAELVLFLSLAAYFAIRAYFVA